MLSQRTRIAWEEAFKEAKVSLDNEGYFLEVSVQYLEKLHDLYNDLFTLLDRKNQN